MIMWFSGHNFGSEHDPDTKECAPGDTKAEGGKYIMYPASVSGQLRNNKVQTQASQGSDGVFVGNFAKGVVACIAGACVI